MGGLPAELGVNIGGVFVSTGGLALRGDAVAGPDFREELSLGEGSVQEGADSRRLRDRVADGDGRVKRHESKGSAMGRRGASCRGGDRGFVNVRARPAVVE